MKNLIEFLDRHKGVALLLGGLISVTFGALWWLAKGGAVALIVSVQALSDREVAETLRGLPEYHARVEAALADLQEGQDEGNEAVRQLADVLEAFRAERETIVEWAPEHSQRLTDAVGGCYAGEPCTTYFRGRRTQAGAGCTLDASRPRLLLADGREFPTRFVDGHSLVDLSTEFETVEAKVLIPGHIPPGIAGVVVLTFYANCPFADESEIVERETFRLIVEILER